MEHYEHSNEMAENALGKDLIEIRQYKVWEINMKIMTLKKNNQNFAEKINFRVCTNAINIFSIIAHNLIDISYKK
jgi:hypothetical protein